MSQDTTKTYGTGKLLINLNSPRGNAFELLGIAGNLMDQLKWKDEKKDAITEEMMNGDYDHLLATFEKYFGRLFKLYYSKEYKLQLEKKEWGHADDDESEDED